MTSQPFWESTFEDLEAPDPFGPPAEELRELASLLPSGSTVLDLGSGAGRNALYMAEHGFRVTAVDISGPAIHKLQHRARQECLDVHTEVCDLREYALSSSYHLIIAHGVLHLLERGARDRLLGEMQAHTEPGGYNVVVVFTDTLPAPEDLREFMVGLFQEGEVFNLYARWDNLRRESYVLEDEHPGGIRHRHAVNKLVAQKPMT